MAESLAQRVLARALAIGSALKLDGWVNTITGIGLASRDKAEGIVFSRPAILRPEQASDLFHFDDLAQTICSAVPEDATREGIEVVRESDDSEPARAQEEARRVTERLTELGAVQAIAEGMIWGRVVGGAGVLIMAEGSGPPNTPLDDSRAGKIARLMVVDRQELSPIRWYLQGPKAGEPEIFYLNPTVPGGTSPMAVEVHETRFIWFGGAYTSRRERLLNGGWDYSVLQRMYPILSQTNSAWGSVIHMLQDMSQAVFKLRGLLDAIDTDGEEAVVDRTRVMDMVRSIARAVVLDAGTKDEPGESFEVVERGAVTGVDALVDKLFLRLAAAARMPVTRLMGQSPAGLNATGAADVRWWYDTVRVAQNKEITPRYLRLVKLVAQELGLGPEGWSLVYPPLWQMTDKEKAELRKLVADTDSIYIDKQVALAEEITLSRWGSGAYSIETKIDLEARRKLLASMEAEEKGANRNPDPQNPDPQNPDPQNPDPQNPDKPSKGPPV